MRQRTFLMASERLVRKNFVLTMELVETCISTDEPVCLISKADWYVLQVRAWVSHSIIYTQTKNAWLICSHRLTSLTKSSPFAIAHNP